MSKATGNGSRKRPSLSSFPGISQHDLRRVAVEAACDPRVVVKYLRRMPQPSTMRARIEQALKKCELDRFVVQPNGAPLSSAPPPGLAKAPPVQLVPPPGRAGGSR